MKEATKDSSSKSKIIRYSLLAILLLGGGYYGYRTWAHAQAYESTDNAQLDASIISVRSSVSGFVKSVHFRENQHVKKGDTLVVIDPVDYVAKVMQARAMLKSAESQTGVSRNTAQAALQNATAATLTAAALQANIESANAKVSKAQKELDRLTKMFAQGAATQVQLDAAQSELQSTTALQQMTTKQYQASLSQSGSIESNARSQHELLGVTNASVQQRLAELQLAESQLEHTVIVAPFDGIVSKKAVEVGQLLQPSQPVCSAVAADNLWVTAIFKETQLGRLKTGQTVRVSVDAYPDLKLQGTIESFGPATGARFALLPPDNSTGNFVKITQRVPVRIQLDKIAETDHPLAPGMSVMAEVKIQ
jgi:membrane fusion protein (multidrug efflux system)